MIGFPYIFRGALDCGASSINEAMKIAAVYAISALAKEPVPSVVDEAYGLSDLHFGSDYILPKALDPRLLLRVAPAVARAAMESGIAARPIDNWDNYAQRLRTFMGDDGKFMRTITEHTAQNLKKVVFGEGNLENVLKAAARLYNEKTLIPVLLGNAEMINRHANSLGLDISGIEIINPRHDREENRRERYAHIYSDKRARQGISYAEALDKMYDRTFFGMMMVETGDADAFMATSYSAANKMADRAVSIVGLREGFEHFATMHIMNTRVGTYFLADTAINPISDTKALVDIARLANQSVRYFNQEPVMAMLSYSNFGSNSMEEEPARIAEAVKILHEKYPEIQVDGEMQADYALNTKLRDSTYPFNTIKGKDVNTLIFPNLSSANIGYKLLLGMGVGNIIGPLQIGLKKPIYFISVNASTDEIVDLATIAALDAIINDRP